MSKSSVLFQPPPPSSQPNTFNFGAGIIPKATDNIVGVLDNPELSKQWNCAHCAATNQIWLDNIGTYQCSYHTLPFDGHRKVWSCCKTTSGGCRRRDHTPHTDPLYPGATSSMAIHNGAPTFVLPVCELNRLSYHERAVVRTSDQPDMCYIVRIDPVQ